MLTILISFIIGLAIIIYTYVILVQFKYWRKRNVFSPPPQFPFGNIKSLIFGHEYGGFIFARHYREARAKNHRHFGMFMLTNPIYVPTDPELFKHIFVKDFAHFMDRGFYVNEKTDPLSGHLFSLEGQKWKNLRAKLSPTFTSGKMKIMFNIVRSCSDEMLKKIHEIFESGEPMDTKDILARFTTDVIGNCAFGIECNSLKDPEVKFLKVGRKVFQPSRMISVKAAISTNYKQFAKFIGMNLKRKEISDFFLNLTNEVVEYREKNSIERNDFLNLLIRLKHNQNLDDASNNNEPTAKQPLAPLTNNEVAAQAFVFFVAGFETSSSTMTFCLYELSKNFEIQDKVRQEIHEILRDHDGKLTYEGVMDATYLDQVVNETLRKYPTIGFLPRICTKRYRVPGSDLILEKNTRVMIPVYGVHHDPEYYPEPERFDPDRFSESNKSKRPNFTFFPFGEGPRICIGMRFGLMQAKIGLMQLLNEFEVSLNAKTEEPIKFVPNSLVFGAKSAVFLNLKKI